LIGLARLDALAAERHIEELAGFPRLSRLLSQTVDGRDGRG
jgi:hypothetical protein